ncbi:hypothetical protein [Aliarcobacter butzleri]|uniref:hypothetical protein n=1 Tax=Aliarcobacter butzleri TaxID=28197 RepID=UPI003AFB35F2
MKKFFATKSSLVAKNGFDLFSCFVERKYLPLVLQIPKVSPLFYTFKSVLEKPLQDFHKTIDQIPNILPVFCFSLN